VILLALAAAWLAGVIVAAVGLSAYALLILVPGIGGAVGFIGARKPALAILALAAAALAMLGVARYESTRPPAGAWGVAVYNDLGSVRLRGVVIVEPEERLRSQRLTVRVDGVDAGGGWTSTKGRVLVTTRLFPRFEYGDRLEMTTRLETPPVFDTFDYREYLARQGIVSTAAFPQIVRVGTGGGTALSRALIKIRTPLGEALQRSLPEPEAALARGILLGQRTSIPRDLTEDLNRAGISHLVAISGYNVTLVAGMTVALTSWLLGRRRATLGAMLAVVFFVFLVGAAPSVLRAGVMGIVMLGATLAGRPGHGLTSIAFAAALLTLFQPTAIDDVAFQLSFASTLGLILFSAPLSERLQALLSGFLPRPLAGVLGENLGITSASTLAVLPIIGATFGRVSLMALPANVFAVPAFAIILATSALTAVAASVSTELGRVVSPFAQLPLAYMIAVGQAFAGVPGASLSFRGVGLLEALLIYAALSLAFVLLLRRMRPSEEALAARFGPALPAAVLALAVTVSLLPGLLAGGGGRLVVTVLDIGQGDAILVQSPAGHRILVDGGPSGALLAQALGRELPANVRRIDLVVLTHGHDDHVAGLVMVAERFEVGAVLVPPLESGTSAYRAWLDLLESQATPVIQAVAGEWIDLGRGARIEVLWPPPEPLLGTVDDFNNNSVVLRLVYGDTTFLLTGDLAAAGEESLARSGDVRATVLKLGHHGSDLSSTPSFLAAVGPAVAVGSSGEGNQFGHPSPTTLLWLAGIPVYRTDRNGSVRFETDGRGLWIRPEKGGPQFVQPRPLPVGAP
jgi:competence protein ComEC